MTESNVIEPLAYSIKGAARAVSLSPRGLQKKIEIGELATFKAGGRTLIAAEDLRKWIAERKAESQAA